jgi:peptidyl-prolyl cis-trans isomerase D
VRTTAGWHVVQFRELIPGSAKPFEEVRAQLEGEYIESEREKVFRDASAQLTDAILATPAALKTVAEKVKLPVRRTAAFSAVAGEGVAALPLVRKAAFEEDQKLERQVSDPIEISGDHVIVLQVVEHVAEAAKPLAEVRDRVINDITADRIAKATQARAEALLARVRAGEPLDTIATEIGRTVADVPAMQRTAPGPQFTALVDAAFATPRPAEGKPQSTTAKLASGEYALVLVDSVQDGDPATLDAATRDSLRQQIAQARGIEDARAFVQALRKQYKVTVAEDRL